VGSSSIDIPGFEIARAEARGEECRPPGDSGSLFILVRVQVETNYPGPARQAMQPTSVGGQTGQPLLQLLNHRS
jgi:hypothetical protein